MRGLALALPVAISALICPVFAQAQSTGQSPTRQVIEVPSPILTLDWEELYTQSAWGRRVSAELEVASSALNRENSRIADGLVEEERSLTERRAKMAPEAFRTEADAFDQRVIGIRRAQETKARSLTAQADSERSRFITAAIELLDGMIEARGAVVVIDRRAIIRGAGAVDVTEDMVARADAALGDGQSTLPEANTPAATAEDLPAPATPPEPAQGVDQVGPSETPQNGVSGTDGQETGASPTEAPAPMAEPKPRAKPTSPAP